MSRASQIVKRTLKSFYDDQMTHHAAALTYYLLMSMFPAALLGISLLGLLGEFPKTYDAIMNYLEEVAPDSVIEPLDRSLRKAFLSRGTATTTLVLGVMLTLYGTTGALEAARRALNVVFELDGGGRGFLRRKAIDIGSTVVLMTLALVSLLLVFVGGRLADDLLGFIGLDAAADLWDVLRWPVAFVVAMFAFAYVYFVTPDVRQRAFRWLTPGAAVAVLLWLAASLGLSAYVSRVADVGAVYGTFAGAIILVGWLWLTNVALLLGAELNAEIEREKELAEGTPRVGTLNRPARG